MCGNCNSCERLGSKRISTNDELGIVIDDTMADLSKTLDSLFFTYQELAQLKAKLEKTKSI